MYYFAVFIVLLFFTSPAHAATQSWTAAADFSGWNLASTSVQNDAIQLNQNPNQQLAGDRAETFSSPRYSSMAVWDDVAKRSYIFGGYGSGGELAQIVEHNPATGALVIKGALPNPRYDGAAVINPANRKVYIFGGRLLSNPFIPDVVEYDPVTNSAVNKSASFPDNRHIDGLTAVWDPSTNKAYLFGGYDHHNFTPIDLVYEYDPVGDTLTVVPGVTLPTSRYGISSAWDSVHSRAYIFGGYDLSTNKDDILEFNPAVPNLTIKSAKLPTARSATSATFDSSSGKIYIFGGYNVGTAGNDYDDILEYNPTGDSITLTATKLPRGKSDMAAIWNPDTGRSLLYAGAASFNSLNTITEYPLLAYEQVGTASYVFTPTPGKVYDWQSINLSTGSTSASGSEQTITAFYTSNTNCSTGLKSAITSVSNSESLCIKLVFETTNILYTPILFGIDLTYTTPTVTAASSGSVATPRPTKANQSPTPAPEPTLVTTATNGSVKNTAVTPSAATGIIDSPAAPIITLSAVTGAATLAAGGTALPTAVTTFPSIIGLGFIARRRSKATWGRVVSSLSGDGIAGAYVFLYDKDKYNRLVERTVSGRDGRFGFLAAPGNYFIKVERRGYTFPARYTQSGYHGEVVTVDASGILQTDIPLDPASLPGTISTRILGFANKFRRPILAFGSILIIFNFFQAVTVLNVVFAIYYAILWLHEIRRGANETHHLLIVEDKQGNPLPYAVVRLKDPNGQTLLPKVADAEGRVYLAEPGGAYSLEIKAFDKESNQYVIEEFVHVSQGTLPKGYRVQVG